MVRFKKKPNLSLLLLSFFFTEKQPEDTVPERVNVKNVRKNPPRATRPGNSPSRYCALLRGESLSLLTSWCQQYLPCIVIQQHLCVSPRGSDGQGSSTPSSTITNVGPMKANPNQTSNLISIPVQEDLYHFTGSLQRIIPNASN